MNKENQWRFFYVIICVCQDTSIFAYNLNTLPQTPSPSNQLTSNSQQTTSLNQQTSPPPQTPSPSNQQTSNSQQTTSLNQQTSPPPQTPSPSNQQTSVPHQTTPLNQQTSPPPQTTSPSNQQTSVPQQTTPLNQQTSPPPQTPSPSNQQTSNPQQTTPLNQQTSSSKESLHTTTSSLSTTDMSNSKGYMDLVIMLDASGSLGLENFQKTLKFVNSLVDQADIDSGFVRIGILKYFTSAKIVFHLNDFNKTVDIKPRISKIVYNAGMTNPAAGIMLATNKMFQSENGDRQNVDNILIIMTDGTSNTDTTKTVPSANAAKENGIRIITIGVGVPNYTEMVMVSSKPLEENQYILKSFDDLKNFTDTFFNILATVEVEEKRRCKCPCTLVGNQEYVNMTADQLNQAIAELKAELVVNKTSLSSFIYKKKSAPDSRSSSLNIGIAGAVFLSVPFVVLFIFDMVNVYQYFIR